MDTPLKPTSPQEQTIPRPYKTVGTRPIRPDGADKVTGRAQFGADIQLPGMLYGKVLRSPHAHARIVSVDRRAAEALPGVKAVVTAVDLAESTGKIVEQGQPSGGADYASQQIVAHDKVFYHGHAVAAVAATSPHIAEDAAKLIRVEYEVLPHVLGAREAMRDDAPILHEGLRTNELGRMGDARTNVASHSRTMRGDVEAGFAQAQVVVEREFLTQTVHQGYIEPHTATALWNDNGHVQIWCSTQGSHSAREQVAAILRLPLAQITVTPMEVGGGFGGKNDIYLEPLAAMLSKKSGCRPVKMTMTRAEVLSGSGPGSGSYIKVKIGADSQGRITAAQVYMAYEAGGFPGSWVNNGAGTILAPYKLENIQIDGYDVVVNKPKVAAYRAPGAPNAVFAAETVIDELAEMLGIDPLDFRLLNGAKEGDRRHDGMLHTHMGYLETITAAKNHPHYLSRLEGSNRGRGVASTFWGNWGGRSSVSASVNADGTVNLVEGSVDLSTSRTAVGMQLAETLDIPFEDVYVKVVDSDSVGFNDTTGGSRTTFATGMAAYELGKKLQQRMAEAAAEFWDVNAEQVTVEGSAYSCDGESLTFQEIAKIVGDGGVPVMASASVHPQKPGGAAAVHIVDVEVDPETGKVSILRYTALQDVGTAVHPPYVEGQIQGGAAQGIGWALNEEYWYDEEGRLCNASLLDYRMPTALDLPMIDTQLVEIAYPGHPFGVRGVGEAPIIPPAGAIANAIHHATGVRMAELPMSPARLLKAMTPIP